MGTSSLYKGPKSSVLLPPDYIDNSPGSDENNQNSNNVEDIDVIGTGIDVPRVSWGSAKSIMTKSYSGDSKHIHNAVAQYTKALGGFKNAARQASSAKRVTTQVIRLFSGSVIDIKNSIEDAGIIFEGRTPTDIFLDIRDVLAPIPETIEDSYVNKAVSDTIEEIISDNDFDISVIDNVLNADILERMVCGVIKNYIYEKLMGQDTLGIIKHETNPQIIKRFEKTLKDCIEGLVSGFIPPILKDGLGKKEISKLVDELYDISYQAMEGMIS